MSAAVDIVVNGFPAPQGSKVRGRYGGVYEASKKVGPWRDAVRTEAQRACKEPMLGPVFVRLVFRLPRPKSHYGTGRNSGFLKQSAPDYPTSVPDLDKLIRSTCDGLTEGGAYKDDSQVVAVHAEKVYAAQDEVPGADISVILL